MNKNKQVLSNRSDDPRHQLAVELRILGLTYGEIARNPQISLKENTIRAWFMKSGVCFESFKNRQKERISENNELFDNLHIDLKRMAIDAIKTLSKAVKKGDVNASVKVLDIVDIKQLLYHKTHHYEDEGVNLLRRIITDRRKHAKTS